MSEIKRIVLSVSALLLISAVILVAFTLSHQVGLEGTFWIEADGSVGPRTTLIQRAGNLYTLTGNINGSIIVERDNIMIDGAGYTLKGKSWEDYGIDVSERNNVTIQKMTIRTFYAGIWLGSSSNNNISTNNIIDNSWAGIRLGSSSSNIISGNNIINNGRGIFVDHSSEYNTVSGNKIINNGDGIWIVSSSNNNISGNSITNKDEGIRVGGSSDYNSFSRNNITRNGFRGIGIFGSSYNRILENNITANNDYGIGIFLSSSSNISRNYISANSGDGINLYESSTNNITENEIANNGYGIRLENSSGNSIYHNNFTDNDKQTYIMTLGYANVWDEGYPSGGNYWSDYEKRYPAAREIDESGVWNSPYIIEKDNQDNYPLLCEPI